MQQGKKPLSDAELKKKLKGEREQQYEEAKRKLEEV